jgi:hypothetical protein
LSETDRLLIMADMGTRCELSVAVRPEPSEEDRMGTLTPELRQAVEEAGDSPVRLTDPETHRMYVLVPAEQYDRLLDEEDLREQAAFLRVAKKNAKARLREGAGLGIRAGAIAL